MDKTRPDDTKKEREKPLSLYPVTMKTPPRKDDTKRGKKSKSKSKI